MSQWFAVFHASLIHVNLDAFKSYHWRLENFPLWCLWRAFFSLFLILSMHTAYKHRLHGSPFQNRASAPASVFSSVQHFALFSPHIDDSAIACLELHSPTVLNYIVLPAFVMHLLLGSWPTIALLLWKGASRKLSSRTIFLRGLEKPFPIFCAVEKLSSGDALSLRKAHNGKKGSCHNIVI